MGKFTISFNECQDFPHPSLKTGSKFTIRFDDIDPTPSAGRVSICPRTMKKLVSMLAMVLGLAAIRFGCSFIQTAQDQPLRKNIVQQEITPSANNPIQPKIKIWKPTPAEQAVCDFMKAISRGDVETMQILLTPTARKVREERGASLLPQLNDAITFHVEGAVPIGNSTVSVTTQAELKPPGPGHQVYAEGVWTVVLLEEGWRISGVDQRIDHKAPEYLRKCSPP